MVRQHLLNTMMKCPSWLAAICLAGMALSGCAEQPKAPSLKHDRMGVATHFARKEAWMQAWDPVRLMPQIADLDVGWIRDEIMWAEVEPQPGQYRMPEKTRQWVDLANAHGLKIVACFAGQNPLYQDRFDPDGYAKAAAWLSRALDGKIHAIEILNEPMSYYAAYYGEGGMKGGNWWGLDNQGEVYPWVRRYVTLLNKAAEAIKEANPRMPVIGLGSLTPINYHQLKLGISPHVDGITEHPYSFRTPPEVIPFPDTPAFRTRHGFAVADKDGSFISLIEKYREFSAQHHGPGQLWLTEWGYTTFREGAPGKKFLYSAFSEQAQAAYSLRRFVEGLALEVEVSILYDFLDDGREGGEWECENGFGLIRRDFSRKPAYAAVQRLARVSRGFVPKRTVEVKVRPFSDRTEDRPVVWDGTSLPALKQIRQYQFVNARGQTVIALWSCERLNDLNVRAADVEISGSVDQYKVEVLDLLSGQTLTPEAVRQPGKIVLARFGIPVHPVFVTLIPNPTSAP